MSRTLYPRKQRRKRRINLWPILVVLVLAGYITYTVLRPIADVYPSSPDKQLSVATGQANLTWPPTAQAAVAIPGTNILTTHGTQNPVPIASTAKVITALTVLDKKPLQPGQQGPVITLTDADVALYNAYAAQDGSLVPVSVGEQISEYQMLQAIMLPSANNIADTMAIWAFGSLSAYADAANVFVKAHGMPNTHIGGDASGFLPSTTSTARDLVKLGVLATKSAVLSEIMAQPSTTAIPETGMVKNVNFLLGTNNIFGVKTGNTDQAGGVFISASRITVGGVPTTIVTSVAGSDNLYKALTESSALVQSAQKNFGPVKLVRKGDVIARYNQPWGPSIAAIAEKDLVTYAWRGTNLKLQTTLRAIDPKVTQAGNIGSVQTVAHNSAIIVQVKLSQPSTKPSVAWRLTHPT